jgi:dTDP-4-amino-4,6-dideoxygalactose transaminase
MGRQLNPAQAELPVTDDLSGRLLRLPLYFNISSTDQAKVCETLANHLRSGNAVRMPSPPQHLGETHVAAY